MASGMTGKANSRRRSFWIVILIALIFATIGGALGFLGPKTEPEWYRPTMFSILAAIIGLLLSFLYSIIYEKFPEIDVSFKRNLERTNDLIDDISFWKTIYGEGHPSARRVLIKNFVEQTVNHILHGSEQISQQAYVRLLYASSEAATKRIFASSLLTPYTWMQGDYHDDYLDYLNLQRNLKDKRDELKITRIFVNKEEEFEKSTDKDEIVKLHIKAKIKIGYFDLEKLLGARGEDFCRDFVLFEDENGTWILDAGVLNIAGLKEEKGAKVRLIDSPLAATFYSDIVKYLTGAGIKWLEVSES